MNFSEENVTQFVKDVSAIEGERDENLAKLEVAVLALIFIVTVVGNGAVLLALWTKRRCGGRKKLSRMYFFILHLSIADLITAFLSVLPQLIWDVTYRFPGEHVLCKAVKYGQLLGPYLSSYILTATAVDRHQAICHPLTYCSWTSRRSRGMVCLAWAASLLFCLPQVRIFSYQEVLPSIYDCWGTFQEPWGEQAYVTWYCISVFVVPLVVLVFTYASIYRVIRISSASHLQPHNSRPAPRSSGKRAPLISRAKINTVKQTIAVILLYVVCSSPFILTQLWATWDPLNPFFEGPIFAILALLYSLNSCMNPWVYLAFNRELPRLLRRHYMSRRRPNKSRLTAGNSPFNSSGTPQTTVLRSPARWSFKDNVAISKIILRADTHRSYKAVGCTTKNWIEATVV